jgi:hypothetical protein
MLLFWRIRYLDEKDGDWKNRDLWLDTNSIDPVSKAALEMIVALKSSSQVRRVRAFRGLFQEKTLSEQEWRQLVDSQGTPRHIFVEDYFEDENGDELTSKKLALALTGNPDAVMFPRGSTPNDIEYFQADKQPIELSQIAVPPDQLGILSYFVRDLRELMTSALMKDGPGSISSGGSRKPGWHLNTAVSDEEIRSFVTIFRRLYMRGEPANFLKAVDVFADAVQGYPIAKWIRGIANQYQAALNAPPTTLPFRGPANPSFTQKRIIDVYLYTRYAHQPDEQRTRQFNECLSTVNGDQSLLTYLFLSEIWTCAITIRNAGAYIQQFYDHYCQAHNLTPVLLASIQHDHPGLGTVEKQEDRDARILEEHSIQLAKSLWQQAGQPEGGYALFIPSARRQLLSAMGKQE